MSERIKLRALRNALSAQYHTEELTLCSVADVKSAWEFLLLCHTGDGESALPALVEVMHQSALSVRVVQPLGRIRAKDRFRTVGGRSDLATRERRIPHQAIASEGGRHRRVQDLGSTLGVRGVSRECGGRAIRDETRRGFLRVDGARPPPHGCGGSSAGHSPTAARRLRGKGSGLW